MVARATEISESLTTTVKTVLAGGGAAVLGMPAKFGTSDTTWTQCGVDTETYAGPFAGAAAEGATVGVHRSGLAKHVVGTGGATRGKFGIVVADGYTDAPAHDSDGTGNERIVCQFEESGDAGDLVGALIIHSQQGS